MNKEQRAAAERLAAYHAEQADHFSPFGSGNALTIFHGEAAALLRELLAEPQPAIKQFNGTEGVAAMSPLERLRFFCSLAMNGQDWLDSEPFFDALAEQQGEPVAWGVFVDDELFKPFNCKDEAVDWFQAQYNHGSRYDYLVLPLYAAPQQRKPLTDKEIIALPAWDDYMGGCITLLDFARAIERAITGEPT